MVVIKDIAKTMRPMAVKGSSRRGPAPSASVAKAAQPHRVHFEVDKELRSKGAKGRGKGKAKGKKAKDSAKAKDTKDDLKEKKKEEVVPEEISPPTTLSAQDRINSELDVIIAHDKAAEKSTATPRTTPVPGRLAKGVSKTLAKTIKFREERTLRREKAKLLKKKKAIKAASAPKATKALSPFDTKEEATKDEVPKTMAERGAELKEKLWGRATRSSQERSPSPSSSSTSEPGDTATDMAVDEESGFLAPTTRLKSEANTDLNPDQLIEAKAIIANLNSAVVSGSVSRWSLLLQAHALAAIAIK